MTGSVRNIRSENSSEINGVHFSNSKTSGISNEEPIKVKVIIDEVEESEANCFPKDRGWSWAVLLSAFLLHTIAIGLCLSSGLFLVEFMEVFQTQKAETAWISSMQFGVAYLIAAPVSGSISQRFSHRTSIIAGGFIMFFGMFTSTFANGIVYLYLSCGLVTGFGIGLVYSPSIGIIGFYFDSRLPLALGIVMAGGGAGAMVFSILFRYLIEQYQWRGALMITSAIALHCCAFGALMFPKSFWSDKQDFAGSMMRFMGKERLKFKSMNHQKSQSESTTAIQNGFTCPYLQPSIFHEKLTENDLNNHSNNGEKFLHCDTNNESSKQNSNFIRVAWVKLKHMKFPLLRNIRFILFFFNSLLMCFGTFPVFIMFVDYAESCGIDRMKASMLLSLLGLMSAAGRFVMAAVMMLLCGGCHVSALHPYVVVTLIASVATLLMPLSGETFASFVVVCAMFGFAYGGICSSSPMVVSEFFGAEQLTIVYPYILMASGIGSLLGPPFSGWMFEVNGSYRLSFLLNGFAIALSVLLLLPLSYLSCRQALKRRQLHTELIVNTLPEVTADTNNSTKHLDA